MSGVSIYVCRLFCNFRSIFSDQICPQLSVGIYVCVLPRTRTTLRTGACFELPVCVYVCVLPGTQTALRTGACSGPPRQRKQKAGAFAPAPKSRHSLKISKSQDTDDKKDVKDTANHQDQCADDVDSRSALLDILFGCTVFGSANRLSDPAK